MAKIYIYQQLNLKNKLSKQEEQRQNHGYREHFNGGQMGAGCEAMSKVVRGLKVQIGSYRIALGCKYSIGNGVAKELTHMTNGHEQRCGDCLREWEVLGGGGREGKLGQLYSMINKI